MRPFVLSLFARRLRNLLISQSPLRSLSRLSKKNMEDLAVEVCGENGAYYKVRVISLIDNEKILKYLTRKLIFRVMCGIFTRIKSQLLFNTSTYARDFAGRALFICIHCLCTILALLIFHVLFPHSLSNCRRVSYEEARLPPTCNVRCDLYVDDEVEVSYADVKTCLFVNAVPCKWPFEIRSHGQSLRKSSLSCFLSKYALLIPSAQITKR